MKGTIALDIDGTVALIHQPIEKEVIAFFQDLASEGWQFIFITGRTFSWGHEILKDLPFSYYFAAYNGALLLKMPEKKLIAKKFLNSSIFLGLDEVCKAYPTDYVIYTASEGHCVCYYRPDRFAKWLLDYLQKRSSALQEEWIALDSYDSFAIKDFPSIKCFGDLPSTQAIASFLQSRYNLHSPVIKDPYNTNFCVLQVTQKGVSKGDTVKFMQKSLKDCGITIAAGDDNNDISMLEAADISIVMETAPKHMLKNADIIAESAGKKGIIQGLKQAIIRSKR